MIPFWKRPLDVLCVLLTLPLWLPLLALCAIWIQIVSHGSTLFRQERVGLGGRTFTLLKFRTMIPGADTRMHDQYLGKLIDRDLPMTKLDSVDTRLIPGGRFLRASGLDELPQLLNVLRGDMSLVGPRPCTPSEFAHYRPSCFKRFCGLPGLTGSWQVNGKNRTTFRRMVALDILYLRRASVWSDLRIMVLTGPALWGQIWEMWGTRQRRQVRASRARLRHSSHASPHRQATQIFSVAKTMVASRPSLSRPTGVPATSLSLPSRAD